MEWVVKEGSQRYQRELVTNYRSKDGSSFACYRLLICIGHLLFSSFFSLFKLLNSCWSCWVYNLVFRLLLISAIHIFTYSWGVSLLSLPSQSLISLIVILYICIKLSLFKLLCSFSLLPGLRLIQQQQYHILNCPGKKAGNYLLPHPHPHPPEQIDSSQLSTFIDSNSYIYTELRFFPPTVLV